MKRYKVKKQGKHYTIFERYYLVFWVWARYKFFEDKNYAQGLVDELNEKDKKRKIQEYNHYHNTKGD